MARRGFTIEIQKDNSKAVMQKLQANLETALDQMGLKCRNLILYQLQQGFGRPIRKTGDLQRSIDYEVEGNEIIVGVRDNFIGKTEDDKDMSYGIYVHEGTSKMAGRPYIRNALFSESRRRRSAPLPPRRLKTPSARKTRSKKYQHRIHGS